MTPLDIGGDRVVHRRHDRRAARDLSLERSVDHAEQGGMTHISQPTVPVVGDPANPEAAATSPSKWDDSGPDVVMMTSGRSLRIT